MSDKKLVLPVLITRGLVVFPNIPQVIDAGRNFSINSILESRDNYENKLLIVSQKNPNIDDPKVEDLYDVGVLADINEIIEMKRFYRIRTTGFNKVKLDNINKKGDCYYATFSIIDETLGEQNEEIAIIKNVIKSLDGNKLAQALPKDVVDRVSKGISSLELANLLGTYLQMSVPQKQTILELNNVNDKLLEIIKILNAEKQIEEINKNIEDRIRESTDKTQKEYFLRERMKAIKEELGEDPNDGSDAILEKLEKNPYPEYVKVKIRAELKRFEMMPQASLESSLIKSYIDLVMSLPWYTSSKDNDDLDNVRKILDEDHYGLEKIKERIVEYLAVKKMTGNLKAPILCFYGPPGVGKTSLGRSIARALDRKFIKSSLGGISDEAEIRGHRRTYVGSMPGRIIAGMKKVGVNNPVFLLDEVDKLASNYKGDPASALLEVLDPEQNYAFNDNYIEEPYDLSNVLFIATANYLENIPAPLRDRLELIEVNSYTEYEKLRIAKDFLVKKQLQAHGLDKDRISFTDDGIRYIINFYTRESGVRELERLISKIIRKVIVEILTNQIKDKVVIVDQKAIEKYLGTPIFENTKKLEESQIGVVTGLAYTQYGGDILPIEVNNFPGKGALILTGKLGDVMKESASIALDYVRSNADRYGIDKDVFLNNDIHVHVPEGAVPKDGPSAGVAITTSIISCLTKIAVRNDVAMTGEVTLRGNALPIGGLREKSLAALRSGIKTIIVPSENKKNVDELPEEVKDNLNIVFMNKVDDALGVALTKKIV